MRSPDDTPLRDGNRDRLMGLLTERAVKTLAFYFMELNPTLNLWLNKFLEENPIPRDGNWDDVSGEAFLRKLLSMPMETAKFDIGRPEMFDCNRTIGVNPREIATRIMSIRSQIAKEFVQELKCVSEENSLLMRETLVSSFSLDSLPVIDPSQLGGASHPELRHPELEPDDSAAGNDD